MKTTATKMRRLWASFALILAFVFSTEKASAQCPLQLDPDGSVIEFVANNVDKITKYITVSNHSNEPLEVTTLLTGAADDYFLVSPAEFVVKPEKPVQIAVKFNASAAEAGHHSATLAFSTGNGTVCTSIDLLGVKNSSGGGNEGKLKIIPEEYVFDKIDVGDTVCKEFTMVNASNATIYIPSWSLDNNASDFHLNASTTQVIELAKGDSATIVVCYVNSGKGRQTNWLLVNWSFDSNATQWNVAKAFFASPKEDNGGGTKDCVGSEPGDNWNESIMLGGSIDHILKLINKSAGIVRLTAFTLHGEDAKAFDLDVTLPAEIANNSALEIPFTFTPYARNDGTAKEKYISEISFTTEFSTDNGATWTQCSYTGVVYGFTTREHKDKDTNGNSVAIPLHSNEKVVVGLKNRGIEEEYTLLFVNNLDNAISVKSISMKEGTHYTVVATNPSTLPFTLQPGETFTATIHFQTTDGKVHKDALQIVVENAATTIEIDFQGISEAFAKVSDSELPEGVTVSASPVPSKGDVTVKVEGIRSITIEIFDMLGNILSSGSTMNEWKWNGATPNGAQAANGSYIIRISGYSIEGQAFVTSKRILISK